MAEKTRFQRRYIRYPLVRTWHSRWCVTSNLVSNFSYVQCLTTTVSLISSLPSSWTYLVTSRETKSTRYATQKQTEATCYQYAQATCSWLHRTSCAGSRPTWYSRYGLNCPWTNLIDADVYYIQLGYLCSKCRFFFCFSLVAFFISEI